MVKHIEIIDQKTLKCVWVIELMTLFRLLKFQRKLVMMSKFVCRSQVKLIPCGN